MIEKELIIGNNKIFYRENITSSEKSIYVFLHGWESNSESFINIYQNLSNFIAFDFPNMGRSSSLKEPWTLLDFANITKSFLDKKIENKKIIFIVHSFGGRVLLKMLNEFNFENKILQIICIGVPFIKEKKISKTFLKGITQIGKKATILLPDSTKKDLKKKWYKTIGSQDYISINDEITKKTFQNIINEDIEIYADNLKNFKTAFIWGENDKEAPLKYAQIIAKKLNISIYIIKNANHFPFVGPHKEEFINLLNLIIK